MGLNDMGRVDPPLPPLPPAPPSVAQALGAVSTPALQNLPRSTAEQFERIRESVTGRSKVNTSGRRERGNRGLFLTGIALVIILVAVAVATLVIVPRLAPPDRSTPQSTLTGYFNALQQSDYSRAWQFVSASRNDTGSQASFAQNLSADDARYGKAISVRILSIETDSTSHATATVQVTRANIKNTPIVYSVSLSQYDGTTWLVDSIANQ